MKLTIDKQHLVSHSPFDRAIFIWKVVPPKLAESSQEPAAQSPQKKRRKQ